MAGGSSIECPKLSLWTAFLWCNGVVLAQRRTWRIRETRRAETHPLFKPAEGGAAAGAIVEDMERLEQDVFGEDSVFDPHHVQPL